MPLFSYEAISSGGQKVKGTLDAATLQEAKQKLLQLKILAIRVSPLKEKERRRPLSRSERLSFTRELARLLEAGLPLFEALSALEEKYRGEPLAPLLLDLCDQVKSGTPFSVALGSHSETFELLYVSMVANAEKMGRLAPSLKELALLLQRREQLRKQMVTSFTYPALLLLFCLVVLSSLLFYVIPSLKELFEGKDLHPFTKLVFGTSDFVRSAKIPLLLLLSACVAGGIGVASFAPWRQKVYRLALRAPFFKGLFAKGALVRFCRATSTLMEGGIPILQAFQQGRSVMGHPFLEKVIEEGEEKIAQGAAIHAPFQREEWIPPLVPRMVGIAEEGGNLPLMLRQIAEIYEEELERYLAQFTAVVQPVLLLILGGIIGFVLLSVLLPMTDVSSFQT